MASLSSQIRSALAHKINRDIAWTFVSFLFLAISGIMMNVMVVMFRDATSLGIFNLSYAIYLIGSQVAVIGIHNSVMRYAAYYSEDASARGPMLFTAMILTFSLGLILGLTVYLATPLYKHLFASGETVQAIGYTGFGLILFPINKVLISYINGLRHMRALALLQTTRYLIVLLGVAFISLSKLPFRIATLSFFAAELLTTITTLIYLRKAGLLKHMNFTQKWAIEHLVFGGKGALGSILLDMNTRVDILLIGVILNEGAVGIYSFAAMLVDGLQHILSMLRVNFNPVLVATMRDKDWLQAKKLLHHAKIYVTLGVVLLSIMVIPSFYLFVSYFVRDQSLLEGWKILVILFGTYAVISGFTPFDNMLLASGHPAQQTIQNTSIALVNLIFCMILIPIFGIVGAAISTGLSYLMGTVVMLFYSYRLLGWNMIFNKTPIDNELGNALAEERN